MANVGQPGSALRQLAAEADSCRRCVELAASRRAVLFGRGDPGARVMFVAGAPEAAEDELGEPFAGRGGALLDELVAAVGIAPADVFLTHIVQCRPPAGREPDPGEIDRCRPWLDRKLELVRPRVVCPLGNIACKALRDDGAPLSRVHGRPETRVLGGLAVRLLPLYHPDSALYSPELVAQLRADVELLPGLLAAPPPRQPPAPTARSVDEPDAKQDPAAPSPAPVAGRDEVPSPVPGEQLGLF